VKQLVLDSSDQFAFALSVNSRFKQFYIGELENNVDENSDEELPEDN